MPLRHGRGLSLAPVSAQSDRPTLDVTIEGGMAAVKIAVPPPMADSASDPNAAELIVTLRDDLKFSGFFDIVDPTLYRLVPPPDGNRGTVRGLAVDRCRGLDPTAPAILRRPDRPRSPALRQLGRRTAVRAPLRRVHRPGATGGPHPGRRPGQALHRPARHRHDAHRVRLGPRRQQRDLPDGLRRASASGG